MTILKIKTFFAVVIALCFPIINAQQRCRGEPDGNRYPMPDPNSFVVCRGQQEIVQHCRPGFEYDPFARECSLTASQADTRVQQQHNPRPAPTPVRPTPPPARNVVTTTRPRPQPRPATNMAQYNSQPRNPCANQRDGTYLIDHTNRNRFYYCLNREALAGNCHDDLHFNVDTRSCELPKSDARPASPPRGVSSNPRPPPPNRNEASTPTPNRNPEDSNSRPNRPPSGTRPQPQIFYFSTSNDD